LKTKAAILTEIHKPLEIAEVDLPNIDVGQVLVKIHASRICGSQIGEIDGVKGHDRWLPHLLGHEAAGQVVETGKGISHVQPGDEVILHWRPSQGMQCKPPVYKWGHKRVNAGLITTFNEYSVVSENRLTVVAKDFPIELRCLMADTITTGFGIINNDSKVRLGESVVVIGAGGIGSGVILGASLSGANPIIAVDLHEHKLEHAKKIGSTHSINCTKQNLREELQTILGNDGADVIIDGTGSPDIIELCYELVSPQGRVVLFGVPHHKAKIKINTLALHFGKTITGSEGGGSIPHEEIPKYYKLLKNKKTDLSGMVTHRGSLDEVNRLIEEMRAGSVVHAVMHYS
jgi:S-(hydroxymethyl)glutathione dehydrogenase/alcohol dehydrogenase